MTFDSIYICIGKTAWITCFCQPVQSREFVRFPDFHEGKGSAISYRECFVRSATFSSALETIAILNFHGGEHLRVLDIRSLAYWTGLLKPDSTVPYPIHSCSRCLVCRWLLGCFKQSLWMSTTAAAWVFIVLQVHNTLKRSVENHNIASMIFAYVSQIQYWRFSRPAVVLLGYIMATDTTSEAWFSSNAELLFAKYIQLNSKSDSRSPSITFFETVIVAHCLAPLRRAFAKKAYTWSTAN